MDAWVEYCVSVTWLARYAKEDRHKGNIRSFSPRRARQSGPRASDVPALRVKIVLSSLGMSLQAVCIDLATVALLVAAVI
jgi:hypothetical protein